MDGLSLAVGLVVGIVGTVIVVALMSGSDGSAGVLSSRPLRISKDNLTCRDCGTQMKEDHPHSKDVRRWYRCPACGRPDNYIDQERAAGYQKASPRHNS